MNFACHFQRQGASNSPPHAGLGYYLLDFHRQMLSLHSRSVGYPNSGLTRITDNFTRFVELFHPLYLLHQYLGYLG
ncbi:hypothetical protein FGO68_gene14376 [Halteria grandinella]|uniref:Uncharacterized protein n=1 Tax=Halteria grandinella TaxID=5974 RepID=A0A8J8NT40_HALGN|nr:hypothetical protein FGO68_gene14376 [Halteria grandinella]